MSTAILTPTTTTKATTTTMSTTISTTTATFQNQFVSYNVIFLSFLCPNIVKKSLTYYFLITCLKVPTQTVTLDYFLDFTLDFTLDSTWNANSIFKSFIFSLIFFFISKTWVTSLDMCSVLRKQKQESTSGPNIN